MVSKNKIKTDIFHKRTALLTVFLFLCLTAICYRLVKLQLVQGAQMRKQADAQHSIYRKLVPSRGEIKIVDQTLQTDTVATNIKKYLVYAVPGEIKNQQAAAESLAPILKMPAKIITDKLEAGKDKKYVSIKKDLTEEEQKQIQALDILGFYFDSEETRYYPEGSLLSQVLGFVGYKQDGSQKVGLYGLEKVFEKELAGVTGYIDQEKDTSGDWIFGSKRDIQPEQDGVNLILTIDKNIQFKSESVLRDTVTKHGADSGSIIIVNPKTGAVLAMATYPNFNPNEYNKANSPSDFNNQVTTGTYEPGSTFKAITMAAGVNEGKITPDSTFTDTGHVDVDNYTIKNAEPGARGVQTMIQALDFSLNTGAIYVENLVGNQTFLKYINSFGFGKKTGIDLPEAAGGLGNLSGTTQVNYDTSSFGQGISVTPLQMIQAYSAFANNGQIMKPYIVQSKVWPDGKTQTTNPSSLGQPITAKTANAVAAMLVDVVENGFGKRAAVPGYYIAGKTGTAQVPKPTGKGYDPTNNIGSFIGFGPIENPQFLMLVRVDHPRDVQFAESTAGPAFGQMADFILHYYNIPPTRPLPTGKSGK